MKSYFCAAWSACIVAALSACGGSSGGSGTTTGTGTGTGTGTTAGAGSGTTGDPTNPGGTTVTPPATTSPVVAASFPLRAAYGTRQLGGFEETYVVSGTCSGSARSSGARAEPTVFENIPAYAQQQTASVRLTNCTPADSGGPGIAYFDRRTGREFGPIGFLNADVYGVATSAPVIPDIVKVGDRGDITSFALYTDTTKATLIGRRALSYAIESDPSGGTAGNPTAIVVFDARTFDLSGAVTLVEQTRVRISTAAIFTAVSGDLSYSSGTHLTLTR